VFGTPTIYTAAGADGLWRTADDTTAGVSAIGNPYMFTARRYDDETGLYYYRARMYTPTLGRFIQTDPIGYTDGVNWYAYCGNNSTVYIDPWGLCKDDSLNWDTMSTWDYIKLFGGGFLEGAATPFIDLATMPGDYYDAFRYSGMGPLAAGFQSANMTAGKILYVLSHLTLGQNDWLTLKSLMGV
jgi:RHS repeat-associated protein